MSSPQTRFAPTHTQSSSVLGEQIVGRSQRQAVAPPAALKLHLDLNLEVEIAIQAKVNGDITLSLLCSAGLERWSTIALVGSRYRGADLRPTYIAVGNPIASCSSRGEIMMQVIAVALVLAT
ncbi:hypothetical protein IW261DRAFT_1417920 [Armillaria novae-zelandiae]|uniref:Uncharacterized protein n=1 Tax=Armillaria novae-zelandiae TaxID=153914 RepID=A0AA39UH50_9AGAR|nr:hypothetical protein IW261DRAFT_1417920 [Armillaria novae-zelandiae]